MGCKSSVPRGYMRRRVSFQATYIYMCIHILERLEIAVSVPDSLGVCTCACVCPPSCCCSRSRSCRWYDECLVLALAFAFSFRLFLSFLIGAVQSVVEAKGRKKQKKSIAGLLDSFLHAVSLLALNDAPAPGSRSATRELTTKVRLTEGRRKSRQSESAPSATPIQYSSSDLCRVLASLSTSLSVLVPVSRYPSMFPSAWLTALTFGSCRGRDEEEE